jgi:cytochrome c oxidase subunit 2
LNKHFGLFILAAIVVILSVAGGIAVAGKVSQEGGWWLPPAASTYSNDVDALWVAIFWVVIVMFILTEGAIVVFCVLYRRRPGVKPHYTHGSHAAEITWTVIPALMLLTLALIQIGTWNYIKKEFPDPGPGVTTVDVMGEQFAWYYRYKQKEHGYTLNEDKAEITTGQLRVPAGDKVLLRLRSRDVIHSFFIPLMRVKQDAVPGLRQRIWFQPNRIKLIDLKKPGFRSEKEYESGKIWREQHYEWVDVVELDPKKPPIDPDAKFKQGGQYFDKRIAVDINPDFTTIEEKEGVFGPAIVKTTGQQRKVNVLHQGKILKDQAWDTCDYAIAIYEVACAELCGLGHYKMKSFLQVLPRVAYEAWRKDEAEAAQEAHLRWSKFWKE